MDMSHKASAKKCVNVSIWTWKIPSVKLCYQITRGFLRHLATILFQSIVSLCWFFQTNKHLPNIQLTQRASIVLRPNKSSNIVHVCDINVHSLICVIYHLITFILIEYGMLNAIYKGITLICVFALSTQGPHLFYYNSIHWG